MTPGSILTPDQRSILLRGILGDRADSLDPDQLDDVVDEFFRGGTATVLARFGTASEASGALVHARHLSRVARDRLATQTTAVSESRIAESSWSAALLVIESNIPRLTDGGDGRPTGVVGVGPGYRRRGGVREDELCAVVYVDRKRSPSALRKDGREAVPTTLTGPHGITLSTDVVALGKLRRQASPGGSVGPKGRKRRGTIGVFAQDLVDGGTVALTAMHVFGASGAGTACVSPAHGLTGSASLGPFRRGTLARTDAAVVAVDPGVATDNVLPQLGPIRGVRPISLPGDYDRAVRLWGAETGRPMSGVIVEPLVHLPADDIEAAILVEIDSVAGDSGGALVDADGFLLGFLVGKIGPRSGPLRVFTPAALAFQLVSCDYPPTSTRS